LQEVFSFQPKSIDAQGKVRGKFAFSGVRPRFAEKLKLVGMNISSDVFDPAKSVPV
jgi:pilus assembly protein CpaF